MDYFAHIDSERGRFQSILAHLTGTAELAARFAAAFGADEIARRCALLHDIGKYSAAFQRRINGSPERVDHSTAGAVEAFLRRDVPSAFCIAGHHGGLPDMGGKYDAPSERTLMGRVRRRPGSGIEAYSAYEWELDIPHADVAPAFTSDGWSAFFFTRMLFSCLVDADWLDTEAFMAGGAVPRGAGEAVRALSDRLDGYVSKWWGATEPINVRRCETLRSMQNAGSRECGLYTLTVPTGGGKTVSSMAFALRHARENGLRRVIYVIPYTSIIEQTQAVFERIFGAQNVMAHYANVSFSADENGCLSEAEQRRYLSCENWDAPIILTTAVQFFESLFSNRPARCRKLHNIAQSVIVFDEAQTLPVRYLTPCVKAIAELAKHYRCTVLLCTATQPSLGPLLRDFYGAEPQELCLDAKGQFDFFRRVSYRYEGLLCDEALAARLAQEEQVLCVVNSRRQAQALFTLLPREGGYHLSTTMTAAHRRRVLAVIRERLRGGKTCRVISTSLIEAGVDVDFPAVWRAIAGLDSIVQTAGRCNREGRRAAAQSIVHLFDTEAKPPKGLEQNIAAARRVLDEFENIASPEAVGAYFDFLLYTLKDPTALDEKGILRLAQREFAFETVAQRFQLIETGCCTVYIPMDDGAALIESLRQNGPNRMLLRRLGQYAVSVHEFDYRKLYDANAVEPISEDAAILLRTELYDAQTGLSLSPEQELLIC